MANVNITEVRLLNVPLENDYKHTLYFANVQEQHAYFQGRTVSYKTNFSYQRKDKCIRWPGKYDDLITANYVMYKNSGYSTKWYYAFITKMEYVDDGRTDIYIETDVIQTWLFDYNVKPSFVEREHVNNDTIGLHTYPEGLECGEFICNELYRDTSLQDYSIVMQVTEWATGDNHPLATYMGGIPVAGGCYVFSTVNELVNVLQVYDENGKTDAVTNVYLIPTKILGAIGDDAKYDGTGSPVHYDLEFAKQRTLDGYTPKNKKLLCYPYNYLLHSNNTGTSNILQYENFSGDLCTFQVDGTPTVGGSIKCSPTNYKGINRIQEEGIMLGKFPVLSWSADLYTNWLTQNGVNLGVGLATSGLSVIGGIASIVTGAGAIAGTMMIASGLTGVAGTLGQVHQMSFTPQSAKGNVNGGDINTAYKMNLFYFYKMSIKKEYAQIIDEYFDMYGYKICRVKTPNKNHRENYWFTKTIDANIDGAVPNEDMQKIKNCYNTGITFWKNATNIQNYSVSNSII